MTDMKGKKSLFFTLVLLLIAVLIHIYSGNPLRVENQYSSTFYPAISRGLRYIFGWLPFSVGDILYGAVIFWFAWKIAARLKAVFKSKRIYPNNNFGKDVEVATSDDVKKRYPKLTGRLLKIARVLVVIYILFNLLWGINYNRTGIAAQIGLQMEKYNREDLILINGLLVEKVNASKAVLINQQLKYPSNKELFGKVVDAYKQAEKVYPFLKYSPVSLKPSVWSWFGNYIGFTGYYNPFTGEAQVNTHVPKFLQPFTSCHEVAHQLGYAKEMEANFVGYLSATASADTLLHYSTYLDLFMYSNQNLFETDSLAAKTFRKQLSPAVIDDINEWRLFNLNHRSIAEPVFRWVYGAYLKQNQQPQGVLSYDEVTGFIIAYYKKFGKI
ncbi:MAG: DUF3810 domain-containing protein [Ferruginibacter sp.]|nr:DUF3810 domain-containing protein [Ferruginibacter sp.]